METRYWVASESGESVGPFTVDEMNAEIRRGRLRLLNSTSLRLEDSSISFAAQRIEGLECVDPPPNASRALMNADKAFACLSGALGASFILVAALARSPYEPRSGGSNLMGILALYAASQIYLGRRRGFGIGFGYALFVGLGLTVLHALIPPSNRVPGLVVIGALTLLWVYCAVRLWWKREAKSSGLFIHPDLFPTGAFRPRAGASAPPASPLFNPASWIALGALGVFLIGSIAYTAIKRNAGGESASKKLSEWELLEGASEAERIAEDESDPGEIEPTTAFGSLMKEIRLKVAVIDHEIEAAEKVARIEEAVDPKVFRSQASIQNALDRLVKFEKAQSDSIRQRIDLIDDFLSKVGDHAEARAEAEPTIRRMKEAGRLKTAYIQTIREYLRLGLSKGPMADEKAERFYWSVADLRKAQSLLKRMEGQEEAINRLAETFE